MTVKTASKPAGPDSITISRPAPDATTIDRDAADEARPAGADRPTVAGAPSGEFDLEGLIRAKQEAIGSVPGPDPFDPSRLRLSQDFEAAVGVRRLITTIPVRKPSKETFVRTHPDEAFRLPTAVLELKDDREMYLVAPELREELASETTFGPRLLVAAVTRDGLPFLWPIRLPGPDGKIDEWSRSAMEAADLARTRWVRISANMGLQAYDVAVATGLAKEPAWPDLDFAQMLRIAFKGKVIDSMDHPVLRRLRGEI